MKKRKKALKFKKDEYGMNIPIIPLNGFKKDSIKDFYMEPQTETIIRKLDLK